MTVKLLLLDEEDRVLLIHSSDPSSGAQCWYPVGGGVEAGESLQQAALRLGDRLSALLRDGLPQQPIDITEPFPT